MRVVVIIPPGKVQKTSFFIVPFLYRLHGVPLKKHNNAVHMFSTYPSIVDLVLWPSVVSIDYIVLEIFVRGPFLDA